MRAAAGDRGADGLAIADLEHVDRVIDVLDPMPALIDKTQPRLAARLIVDALADADRARPGDAFHLAVTLTLWP